MGDKSSSERRYALQLKHPPKVKGEGEPGEVGSGEVEFGGAKWRTADLKLDAQRQDKKYGGFWKARRPGGEDKDDANGIAPEQIAPPRVVESTESDEEKACAEEKRKPTLRIRTSSIFKKVASKLHSPTSSPRSPTMSSPRSSSPANKRQSPNEQAPSRGCHGGQSTTGHSSSVPLEQEKPRSLQDKQPDPANIPLPATRPRTRRRIRREDIFRQPRSSFSSENEREWQQNWNKYWDRWEAEQRGEPVEQSSPGVQSESDEQAVQSWPEEVPSVRERVDSASTLLRFRRWMRQVVFSKA